MAIYSAISKTKIGIQDVISPYSFDQFLISNAPRTQKRVKKGKKSNNSRNVVSRLFDFTRKSKGEFPFMKNSSIYKRIGHNRWINNLIAINGPDDASFSESARLSHERPIGDGASTVSHVACFEEARRLILYLIRLIGGPPIAINLNRYNSVDGWLRLRSI